MQSYGSELFSVLEDNCDLKIDCPVLLIVGERDKLGKVIKYNKAWTKNTSFPLIIINNASHNSNVDNPDEVNRVIKFFLDNLNK